jgi:uncharacterized protein YkwD
MRRVLGALTAVAVWVAAVLFVTTVYQSPQPPLEVLSVDVRPTSTATPTTVGTTTTRAVASTTTTSTLVTTTLLTTTTAPPQTTTTAAAAPTTAAPRPTSTTAPPQITTTAAPPQTTTTAAPPQTAPPTTAAVAGNYSSQAEAEFVNLINGLRANQGLGGLTVNNSLTQYARNWSNHMAATGTFAHSNIASLLNPWSTVGENLAKGGSVSRLFEALTASPSHYANMVSGAYTHIGVGVWVDAAGVIWATHVFGG